MMKHFAAKVFLGLSCALPLVGTGCVVTARPEPVYGGEVYADEAPPPPPVDAEVAVGVAPGPDFIWIGGFWHRDHDRWVWGGGHWGHRPYAHAEWVGHRWVRGDHGYHYEQGHWR